MSRSQLRYTLLQLSILGIEAIWLSTLSFVMAQNQAGGAQTWWTLFSAGAILHFFFYWLWVRDIWYSGLGRLLSAVTALIVISLLMQNAAPMQVGWFAGPGDWITALRGLSDLFAIPTPLTVSLLIGLLLLYRVMLMVRLPIGSWEVTSRIQLSTMAIISMIIVGGIQGITFSSGMILSFFAFALLALALARAKELSYLSQIGNLPFTARWLFNLIGTIALVLLLSVIMIDLIPWQVMSSVAKVFLPIIFGVLWLFTLLAQLLAYLLTPALKFFWENVPLDAEVPESDEAQIPEFEQLASSSYMFETALPILLLILTTILVLYLFHRLFTRRRATRPQLLSPETEYSTVDNTFSIAQWLRRQRDTLRDLFNRPSRREYDLKTVRNLYRNLLLFGDQHDLPRPIDDTPYEYLKPLCKQYPDLSHDFHTLTDAYVAVHYGEQLVSSAEITHLQQTWQHIVDVTSKSEGI